VPRKRGGGVGFSVGDYNVGIAYFKKKKETRKKTPIVQKRAVTDAAQLMSSLSF